MMHADDDVDVTEELKPINARLTKDLRQAAYHMGTNEVKFLVASYYRIQRERIRSHSQWAKMVEADAPADVIDFMFEQNVSIENFIKLSLDAYTSQHRLGGWLRSNHGVGPVLAAGLLSMAPITRFQYAGKLWSYAGLVPGKTWEKGQLRPWNPHLKTLCWKLGESFVKTSGTEKECYGHIYQRRKQLEATRNESGDFAEQAKVMLAKFNFRDDTVTKEALLSGRLSKAHIHARARRYAVKLFLSHYFEAGYTLEYDMPAPPTYILSIGGHYGYIRPIIVPEWMKDNPRLWSMQDPRP